MASDNELFNSYREFLQNHTKQNEEKFAAALATAMLAAPVTYSMQNENLQEKKPSFRLIFNEKNRPYFPLFSSEEELFAFYKNEKALKAAKVTVPSYMRLFASAANTVDGIVINPAKENIALTREMLAVLLSAEHLKDCFEEQYAPKAYNERKNGEK